MTNLDPICAAEPSKIREMFAAIVGRYDLNNRLHSLWRDQAWRQAAAKAAMQPPPAAVLDVACGTGDLTAMLARKGAARVVGADFCPPMIQRAREKFPRLPIEWVEADAMALPFGAGEFDVVTTAFGLRNLPQPGAALREFARVLKPGGRLVVLDFRGGERPGLAGRLLSFYTDRLMPLTAAWIARDRGGAYDYLHRSILTFWSDADLGRELLAAGFASASVRTMTLGLAMLAVGVKDRTIASTVHT